MGESLQSIASGWPMPPAAPSTATLMPRAAESALDQTCELVVQRARLEELCAFDFAGAQNGLDVQRCSLWPAVAMARRIVFAEVRANMFGRENERERWGRSPTSRLDDATEGESFGTSISPKSTQAHPPVTASPSS